MTWAVERKVLGASPFTLDRARSSSWRRRTISADVEFPRSRKGSLGRFSPPLLRAMIIAALDTGMRQGEMLQLRFDDIDWDQEVIVVRKETTKSKKGREIPISSDRLRDVLRWCRIDERGDPKHATAFIFGNEDGMAPPLFAVQNRMGFDHPQGVWRGDEMATSWRIQRAW